jgi:bifunctional DNA-binding transcriptional regulator/antitoxin component of YhaV-PrlF toxin-antitoxin module
MYRNVDVKDIKDDKKRIMAVVQVVSKNRMTIPRSVRDALSLERGDCIVFLKYQNHIGMVKIDEEYLIDTNETE